MKILKKIGIVLLAIVLILVIISFFISSKFHGERSMEMKASPAVVYSLVNDLHSWEKWDPWHKMDPNMKLEYSEVASGAGAWYSWSSTQSQVGSGKMTILEATEPSVIKAQLNFGNENPAIVTFHFDPTADGTKVTWMMDADMGMMPHKKLMSLMMGKIMDGMFDNGLTDMKALAESAPPVAEKETIGGYAFEERQLPKMVVAGVREKLKVVDISSNKFAEWYGAIGKTMKKGNAEMAGAPMAIYYSYDKVTTDMEAAIPVKAMMKDDGSVKCHELPETKALVVKYYGAYDKTEAVYNAAFAYIKEHGMTSSGAPMEIYVTDPGMEKDTAKWLTEIAFPIK